MEISTPNWSLRFCVSNPSVIQKLANFLQIEGEESIVMGAFDDIPIQVRRDREYGDRFFIIIGGGIARSELVIAGQQQVSELRGALSQVVEDLR